MFGWFDKSPSTIDDIMNKDNGLLKQVGGWIGNMKLTAEEVMEQNGITVASVQAFVVATLEENTERSKSRRLFVRKWMTMHLGVIALACIAAPWNMELAQFYLSIALSPWVCSITGAISIFFFGSHGIRTMKSK